MNKTITTIDLGSNSFRVLKYDCCNHKIIDEYNEVVGMADGLVQTGLISKEAQQRVIEAIKNSVDKIGYNPSEAICVTTAAMRKASNAQEVLKHFKTKADVTFNIIDGIEEARLTLLAVKFALKREKIDSSKFILLDIGGGSTEIIVNDDENHISNSFDFGIVTLTQNYLKNIDLQRDLEIKKRDIKSYLDSLRIDLKEFIFVATAGTPTTIAAIKLGQDFFTYDRNIVNGTIVNIDDLHYSLEILRNSTKEELIKLVGKGRVDYIEVGILIYKMIFEVLNKNESIVLDDGLREGVAVNYCLTNS